MIKREWVTETNGFKVGERVMLYYSTVDLKEDVRIFKLQHLGADWEDTGKPEVMKHGNDLLYSIGHLFPIDSYQFRIWNPFTKHLEFRDPIMYPWAYLDEYSLDVHYKQTLPDTGMRVVIQRPSWAVRLS